MWLVEGLSDDRFAVLTKTHHALVDGISGVDILTVLFGEEEPGSAEWTPRPTPSDGSLLVDALGERLSVPAEAARGVLGVVRQPVRALSEGARLVGDMGDTLVAGVRPAPTAPWNRGRPGRTGGSRGSGAIWAV